MRRLLGLNWLDAEAKSHLILTLVLVCLTAMASMLLQNTPLVRVPNEFIYDKFTRLFLSPLNIAPSLPADQKITLIAIDDWTVNRDPNSRFHGTLVPHRLTAILLDRVLARGPRAVIVDLGLESENVADPDDPKLLETLRRYPNIPIFLEKKPTRNWMGEPEDWSISAFDRYVDDPHQTAKIAWVYPYLLNDEDHIVRQMSTWSGDPKAKLSPMLAMRILSDSRGGWPKLARLSAIMRQCQSAGRASCEATVAVDPDIAQLSQVTKRWFVNPAIESGATEFNSRLIYGYPNIFTRSLNDSFWSEREFESIADRRNAPPKVMKCNSLTILSAADLLNVTGRISEELNCSSDGVNPVARADAIDKAIRGGFVIIGRTDQASADQWYTPIGPLPGSAMLAEAIYTVLAFDRPIRPHLLITVMVLAIAGILLAFDAVIELRGWRYFALNIGLWLVLAITLAVALQFRWWIDLAPALWMQATVLAIRVFWTTHIRNGRTQG